MPRLVRVLRELSAEEGAISSLPDPYLEYKSVTKQLKEIESVIHAPLFIILVYYKDQLIWKDFILFIRNCCPLRIHLYLRLEANYLLLYQLQLLILLV